MKKFRTIITIFITIWFVLSYCFFSYANTDNSIVNNNVDFNNSTQLENDIIMDSTENIQNNDIINNVIDNEKDYETNNEEKENSINLENDIVLNNNSNIVNNEKSTNLRKTFINDNQLIEDGEYKIRFAKENSKLLSVENNSNVDLRISTNILENRFYISYLGQGCYKIKSLKDGKALDVAWGGKSSGTNVRTYDDNGTDAQKWIIKESTNGTYNIVSKCNNLYLDVAYGSTNEGTNIWVYEKNNSEAQNFIFEKLEHEIGEKTLADGEYRIKFLKDTEKVVTLESNNNIDIRKKSNFYNNKFIISYVGNGYYKIISKGTGYSLDVAWAGIKNGTNVRGYEYNGSDAQLWIIKKLNDGSYNIISKCNDSYLDVAYASPNDGTNISIHEKNNTIAQKFVFEKVEHINSEKTLEDGEYKIAYAKDTNKVIAASENSNIQIVNDNGILSNSFNIKFENGYYSITFVKTNKSLDVAWGKQVNGTNVRTYDSNGTDAQQWIIKQNTNGTYNIISRCNDLYVDVEGASTNSGTNIRTFEANGTISQQFIFKKVNRVIGEKTVEDGLYTIKYAKNNKVVSSYSENVNIYTDKDQRYQKFYIKYLGDGYYKIQLAKNNKVLDVAWAGQSNGTNVRTYESNGTDAQQWIIKKLDDGNYNIISKCNGLYLDVNGAGIEDGTNIQMYEPNDTIAQKFKIEKTELRVLDDGMYEISTSVNKNYLLDVHAAEKVNCTNIQIWQKLDENQQKFNISYYKDGFYIIQAVHSGKCVDVAWAGQGEGTNVQQYEYNTCDSQLWKIIQNSDNTYSFISKCNNKYLTFYNGNVSNGTNVAVYSNTGTNSQKFYINETVSKALTGIDVSYSQGKIDWQHVKNSGIQFAIIRCGYGKNISSQDDSYYLRNVAECQRLGIPYGVYIYSYALDVESAKSEADHTLRLLRQANANPTLGVWFDMEDADGYKSRYGMPSNDTLVNICKTYCDIINQNGYKAGIYASLSWLENQLNDSRLDQYDVWVAHWANQCGYRKSYKIWQYTSKGSVDGILNEVDMDILYR